MQLTLGEIAERIGAEVNGDADVVVTGAAGLAEAGPGEITFLANPRYATLVPTTRATAVIVPKDYRGNSGAILLHTAEPYLGFLRILQVFAEDLSARPREVHPTALVDERAEVAPDAAIGALCVIEAESRIEAGATLCPGVFVGAGAVVGAGSYLYPNVTIREQVELGRNVIVHAGAVIGSDGFGYVPHAGRHEKIPQVGTVVVEDDVEIGANAAIDRATTGITRIARGTKIDNLVHIAHNVQVGEDTVICAQVGISGSAKVGKRVTLAGQSGLVGHIQVGDEATVGGQGGVTKSVPPGTRVSGYPAMQHDRARRLNAYTRRLPKLFDRLRELEARLEQLEKESS
jgi:UDP-3-O-[3-hydroxymyristoyl] glucosamine N-acyltransferase